MKLPLNNRILAGFLAFLALWTIVDVLLGISSSHQKPLVRLRSSQEPLAERPARRHPVPPLTGTCADDAPFPFITSNVRVTGGVAKKDHSNGAGKKERTCTWEQKDGTLAHGKERGITFSTLAEAQYWCVHAGRKHGPCGGVTCQHALRRCSAYTGTNLQRSSRNEVTFLHSNCANAANEEHVEHAGHDHATLPLVIIAHEHPEEVSPTLVALSRNNDRDVANITVLCVHPPSHAATRTIVLSMFPHAQVYLWDGRRKEAETEEQHRARLWYFALDYAFGKEETMAPGALLLEQGLIPSRDFSVVSLDERGMGPCASE